MHVNKLVFSQLHNLQLFIYRFAVFCYLSIALQRQLSMKIKQVRNLILKFSVNILSTETPPSPSLSAHLQLSCSHANKKAIKPEERKQSKPNELPAILV